MSYNVAVWVGERPAGDAQAAETYRRLRRYYAATVEAMSPRLVDYIVALTARYPDLMDLADDDVDDSPWADGPLTGNIRGTLLELGLMYSKAEEALPFVAERAREQGLVAFDPQAQSLL